MWLREDSHPLRIDPPTALGKALSSFSDWCLRGGLNLSPAYVELWNKFKFLTLQSYLTRYTTSNLKPSLSSAGSASVPFCTINKTVIINKICILKTHRQLIAKLQSNLLRLPVHSSHSLHAPVTSCSQLACLFAADLTSCLPVCSWSHFLLACLQLISLPACLFAADLTSCLPVCSWSHFLLACLQLISLPACLFAADLTSCLPVCSWSHFLLACLQLISLPACLFAADLLNQRRSSTHSQLE